jgi:hypothetical protein
VGSGTTWTHGAQAFGLAYRRVGDPRRTCAGGVANPPTIDGKNKSTSYLHAFILLTGSGCPTARDSISQDLDIKLQVSIVGGGIVQVFERALERFGCFERDAHPATRNLFQQLVVAEMADDRFIG